MLQRTSQEMWRCPEEEQTVHKEGPGGLPEPAGEELPPVHGVPQASDPAGWSPGKPSQRCEVRRGLTLSLSLIAIFSGYRLMDMQPLL